jgi:CBS domain-containing protein
MSSPEVHCHNWEEARGAGASGGPIPGWRGGAEPLGESDGRVAWTMLSTLIMLVGRFMSRYLLTVTPEDSVSKARVLMREGHVDRLPVVEGRRLVGIVSDRDIWKRLPVAAMLLTERAADDLLLHMSVGGVMDLAPAVVAFNTPLADAARLMRERGKESLAVVDHGELVGLLTESDVVDGLLAVLGAAQAAVSAGDGNRCGAPVGRDEG